MVFWGRLVKREKPVTLSFHNVPGRRFRLSRATLEEGIDVVDENMNECTRLYCKVGDDPEIAICALRMSKTEMCELNLEFAAPLDVVFSVCGPYDISIVGHYIEDELLHDVITPQIDAANGGEMVTSAREEPSLQLMVIDDHHILGWSYRLFEVCMLLYNCWFFLINTMENSLQQALIDGPNEHEHGINAEVSSPHNGVVEASHRQLPLGTSPMEVENEHDHGTCNVVSSSCNGVVEASQLDLALGRSPIGGVVNEAPALQIPASQQVVQNLDPKGRGSSVKQDRPAKEWLRLGSLSDDDFHCFQETDTAMAIEEIAVHNPEQIPAAVISGDEIGQQSDVECNMKSTAEESLNTDMENDLIPDKGRTDGAMNVTVAEQSRVVQSSCSTDGAMNEKVASQSKGVQSSCSTDVQKIGCSEHEAVTQGFDSAKADTLCRRLEFDFFEVETKKTGKERSMKVLKPREVLNDLSTVSEPVNEETANNNKGGIGLSERRNATIIGKQAPDSPLVENDCPSSVYRKLDFDCSEHQLNKSDRALKKLMPTALLNNDSGSSVLVDTEVEAIVRVSNFIVDTQMVERNLYDGEGTSKEGGNLSPNPIVENPKIGQSYKGRRYKKRRKPAFLKLTFYKLLDHSKRRRHRRRKQKSNRKYARGFSEEKIDQVDDAYIVHKLEHLPISEPDKECVDSDVGDIHNRSKIQGEESSELRMDEKEVKPGKKKRTKEKLISSEVSDAINHTYVIGIDVDTSNEPETNEHPTDDVREESSELRMDEKEVKPRKKKRTEASEVPDANNHTDVIVIDADTSKKPATNEHATYDVSLPGQKRRSKKRKTDATIALDDLPVNYDIGGTRMVADNVAADVGIDITDHLNDFRGEKQTLRKPKQKKLKAGDTSPADEVSPVDYDMGGARRVDDASPTDEVSPVDYDMGGTKRAVDNLVEEPTRNVTTESSIKFAGDEKCTRVLVLALAAEWAKSKPTAPKPPIPRRKASISVK